MSLLQLLNSKLQDILPIETGVFSGKPPDRYLVLTPLVDTFELHGDNQPNAEVQEVRISLFSIGNYTAIKNEIVRALLAQNVTITDRRYLGHDDSTGHHQYIIDVAQEFDFSQEEDIYGYDWS